MKNDIDVFLQSIDCASSIWINANAGSGKTYILVHRITKLLLTNRKKILCLTYTKVATQEMELRIREIFYNLCINNNLYRIAFLKKIDIPPSDENIEIARTMLFKYSECIIICTIHSFCLDVLQNAEKEDHKNFQFSEIITDEEQEYYLRLSINIIIKNKNILEKFGDIISINNHYWYLSILKTFKHFFIGTFLHISDIAQIEQKNLLNIFGFQNLNSFEKIKIELYDNIISTLNTISTLCDKYIENKFIIEIKEYIKRTDIEFFDKQTYLYNLLFVKEETGNLKKHSRLSVKEDLKPFLKKNNSIEESILRLQDLLLHYQVVLMCKKIINNTGLFLELCCIIAKEYNSFIGNKITFDDIVNKIECCAELDAYTWMFKRINELVEHILIDEAQDNSNTQWDIIEKIASEFFYEKENTVTPRTIFVVGDIKQSIYSFQGANPKKFFEVRTKLEKMAKNANLKWYNIELIFSYRSNKNILYFIDTLFNSEYINKNFLLEEKNLKKVSHITKIDTNNEGVIFSYINEYDLSEENEVPTNDLLLPKFKKNKISKKEFIISKKIANIVKYQIDNNRTLESEKRAVVASDFLILLRKRGALYYSIINSFQNEKIPINFDELSNTPIFKYLCTLIKFIIHPEIDKFLFIILQYPPFYLEASELYKIKIKAIEANCSVIESINTLYPNIYKYIIYWIKLDGSIVDNILSILTNKQIYLLEKFFIHNNTSEIIEEFIGNISSEEIEILMNIKTLKISNQNRGKAINLRSIHSAKGLESKIVMYIHNCNDGSHSQEDARAPVISSIIQKSYCAYIGKYKKFFKESNMANLNKINCNILNNITNTIIHENNIGNGEEDRALYVALTRAKYELNILYYNLKNIKKTDVHEDKGNNKTFNNFLEKKEFEHIDTGIYKIQENISQKTETQYLNDIKENHEEILFTKKDQKKILQKEEIEKDTLQTKRGTLIHKIMQNIWHIKNDKDKWIRKKLENTKFSNKEKENIIYNILTTFEKHLKQYQNSEKIETEVEICSNLNHSQFSRKIFKIDLLISNISNQNTITVIDFKTGEKNNKAYTQVRNYIEILKSIYNTNTKINIVGFVLWIETQEFIKV